MSSKQHLPEDRLVRSTPFSHNAWFDLLMDVPVGIFAATPPGRLLYVNRTMAELFDYNSPGLMIDAVADITKELYGEPRDGEELLRRVESHGQVADFECRMRRRDGSTFLGCLTAHAAGGEPGGPPMIRGWLRDISRAPGRDGAGISEATVSRVFMLAPDCMVITRVRDGLILDVNMGFEEMTGWKRCEVVGRTVTEIGFWARPADRESVVAACTKEVDVLQKEFQFRRKDGSLREGIVSMRNCTIEGDSLFICILQDITERKRTEEALRLTQFAMDKAPDSILWVDDQGNIAYANEASCASMGFAREELLGKPIFETDPDFPVESWEQHKRDLKRLGKMTFEGRHRRKDGTLFPVEVTTNYVDYKGSFLGISFDRDISERRKTEKERESLQAQLLQAQKMESMGIMAGGIAHDFNNLLHIMNGNIELLAKEGQAAHIAAGILDTLTRTVSRASSLVKQLLLFSRKAEAQMRPLDLNREIEETVAILERTLPKMIDITCSLERGLWTVKADPVQIEQILLNLGTNAADAMPSGGALLIETKNVNLDERFAENHPGSASGAFVQLTVSDTGCGMDKHIQGHLFDPFFTTKEVGRGTGLGLATVYGIVKTHGGHIQCYSEPGQGTTFKIYLPGLEQEVPLVEHGLLPPIAGGDETILVVDDEPEILDLTQNILASFGYSVLRSEHGKGALELFTNSAGSIDLVLLDLNMPGMGGMECLRELLRIAPRAKVIISSGFTANGHLKDGMLKGAQGFIGKPYGIRELATRVREALDADLPLEHDGG